MKHLLLFLSFISFCNTAISQTYKPLIEKGDSWVLWYDWVAPDYTLIKNEKIADNTFMLYEVFNPDTTFYGEVRVSNTNDTAWYYDYQTKRSFEVFNLNLNIGDSVLASSNMSWYYHVDSVYFDEKGLKTIRFKEGATILRHWGEENFFFKEGLGPIEFFFFQEHNVFYNSWKPFVSCKLDENLKIIHSVQNKKFKNCQFGNFSSISHQQETSHQISINNGVLIVIPSCDELSIYNYLGVEILYSNNSSVNVVGLEKGVYIIKVRHANIYSTHKFKK